MTQCFYREDIRMEAGLEIARCGLLEQVCGPAAVQRCTVRRDACESCCHSFPPSPVTPNPVIASLLYGIAGQLLNTGQTEGEDLDRAARLQLWAEAHIGRS